MYESTIEMRANKLMITYLGIKNVKMQVRGWPDRMYLLPNGKVFFIEFKRPGGKLSRLQAHTIEMLKKLGHDVEVIDDAVRALEFACECLEAAQLPDGGDEVLARACRACALLRAGGGENVHRARCIKDAFV